MLQNFNMNSCFIEQLELKFGGLQWQLVRNDVTTNVGFKKDILSNNGN